MKRPNLGVLVSLGGLAWLAGILVLELTYESAVEDLPLSFAVLAVVAGIAVGWGCWSAAPLLDQRLGRVGMRLVAVCSFILGLGFALDVLPDMWLGFFFAYFVGLFALPVAFVILGLGVVRSVVFPKWGKWVPFGVAALAAVTYGFHALAREVWDPPDAVWFSALGVGWILTGAAITAMSSIAASQQEPGTPLSNVRP